jgi:hypothetical protein
MSSRSALAIADSLKRRSQNRLTSNSVGSAGKKKMKGL